MNNLEQRIKDAQEEFSHGARLGWLQGFYAGAQWAIQNEDTASEVPKPANPYTAEVEAIREAGKR